MPLLPLGEGWGEGVSHIPVTKPHKPRNEEAADRRRRLRRDSTDAERALWHVLRNRQIAGVKFGRQHQYGPYVLDFFCVERRLAVEVDGSQHYTPDGLARDSVRTAYLEARGVSVLRFSNLEVLSEAVGVVARILGALATGRPSP